MDDSGKIVIATFYKFVHLRNYRELHSLLLSLCNQLQLKGTILLAEEGINATIAGYWDSIVKLKRYLESDGRFDDMEYKESRSDHVPFYRMKVKLRKEIVSLGVPGTDPAIRSGARVQAKEWNTLINDPDVFLIDVRNQYECDIGSFNNAEIPEIETFTQFPEYVRQKMDPSVHKKVAMYCTGGIRCEKASTYMLNEGFKEVYQLQGGILRYLEQINTDESLWKGECFVFDNRVTLDHALKKGKYVQCYSCRTPLSPLDRKSSFYEEGISCHVCYHTLSEERSSSLRERQRQMKLAEQRDDSHIGVDHDNRRVRHALRS
jgi:UPF0176 protein